MSKNKSDTIIVDIYIGNTEEHSIEILNGAGGTFFFEHGLHKLSESEIDDIAEAFTLELKRLINNTGDKDGSRSIRTSNTEKAKRENYTSESGIKLPNAPTSFKKH